jgi:GGDEF domain-containing protein
VISIRKYLLADRQAEAALIQLVQLLVEGVERHLVEGAPGDAARLRESTQALLASLEAGADPRDMLALGTQAMSALKQNNERAADFLRRPVAELQAKVKILTAAVTAVSGASQENIRHLQQIKTKLLSSMDVRDIRTLRTQLSECLDGVLNAAESQRAETEAASHQLKSALRASANPGETADAEADLDPASGLPSRTRAEETIALACQEETMAFVIVMAINRLEAVTRSFGDQVGNMVLNRFATFVRGQLPAGDRLFRWGGPALVALVEGPETLDGVRNATAALLAQTIEHAVFTGTGEVKLPISSRWTVLPVMTSPRLLFTKMDSFAGFERPTPAENV